MKRIGEINETVIAVDVGMDVAMSSPRECRRDRARAWSCFYPDPCLCL